jgi:hypothetical protein
MMEDQNGEMDELEAGVEFSVAVVSSSSGISPARCGDFVSTRDAEPPVFTRAASGPNAFDKEVRGS